MDLQALDRLPKKQSSAFLQLVGDLQRASSAETLYEVRKKRPYPAKDDIARYIFESLLSDFATRKDTSLWPGWEGWAGQYAQKCCAELSGKLCWFTGRILLAVLVVILALLAYGAWKGNFADMPWLPLVAGAWIIFGVFGLGYSIVDWLRFRGTEWPATPDEARKWYAARMSQERQAS